MGHMARDVAVATAIAASGLCQLHAQQPAARSVTGRVVSKGEPVRGAEVGVVDGSQRAVADDSGRFVLRSMGRGTVRIFARAIGYAPLFTSLTVPENGLADQVLELEPAAQPLPEVRAEARWAKPARLAHTTKYDDFYRRRKSGLGTFLTRDDLDKSTAMRSFELLRGVPGIQVAWNPPGVPGTRVRFSRCDVFPPRVSVWIDGNKQVFTVPVPPGGADRASTPREGASSGSLDVKLRWQSETWSRWLELFDAVRPGEIEAMEIFRGVAQIPAEFLDDSCAAVVIWTREGGRP